MFSTSDILPVAFIESEKMRVFLPKDLCCLVKVCVVTLLSWPALTMVFNQGLGTPTIITIPFFVPTLSVLLAYWYIAGESCGRQFLFTTRNNAQIVPALHPSQLLRGQQ